MSLTAEDIQTKQFHVRFRGFDVEEVDAFLERIAENFVLLEEEKRLLKEQVEKLEMTIKDFHSQERTFQHAIISAQKIADEMQEKSRKECRERLNSTNEEIAKLRTASQEEQESLRHQIETLKESKEKVKEELRAYLHSYLDRLDQDQVGEDNEPLSLLQSDFDDGSREEEEDLGSLYEKIDLGDEQGKELQEKTEAREEEEIVGRMANVLMEQGEDEEHSAMPDLEDDMLFSLEDPLDEHQGPAVEIHEESDGPRLK